MSLPPLPPRQGPPPLPPALPAKPVLSDKWTAHKIGYDRMYLQCNGVLTRLEAFRLIGDLERIAATL
jgi:hypothetical protein